VPTWAALSARELVELHSSVTGRAPVRFARQTDAAGLPAGGEAFAPYFDVRCRFEDARACEVLERAGVKKPDPSDYLDRLIAYAHRSGWGKRPLSRQASMGAMGAVGAVGAAGAAGAEAVEDRAAASWPAPLTRPRELTTDGGYSRAMTAPSVEGKTARIPGAAGAMRQAARRWPYLPLAIACAYLVVLLVHLKAIIVSLAGDADVVVPHELAKLMSSHSGTIVLGDSPWYSTLLFERATRWLPFYRALWDLAPFVATAISFAAVAWSVWRVAGRWAAAITLSLLVCAGASLLVNYGALDNHIPTWMSDSLLIAGLVWVLHPGTPRRRWHWQVLAVVLGLLVALNLASDPLLYAGGIVPVLAGSLVAWRLTPSAATREGVFFALATSGVAVVGAVLVAHFMRENQIMSDPDFLIRFAPVGALAGNVSLWWQSLVQLGGNFSSQSITLVPILYVCAAGLILIAVLFIPRIAQLELKSPRAPRAPADGLAPSDAATRTPARDAFVVAWATSALLVSAAFVLSSVPLGLTTTRYLVGVPIAAAALVPLLARRRETLALVVIAASVYCASGVLSIARGEASPPSAVPQLTVNEFVRLAGEQHVRHGYTGYWDASPITWNSRFRVLAYPAEVCAAGICAFGLGYEASWYHADGATRSFLITDTAKPFMQSAPASLGPPAASFRVAPTYTFLVYDYDIATKMQP
jgi:hypothetical protein